ncbi:hypothetical protein M408DRAFT_17406 [Serendipita vermifera MAFF 305830]|uniref:Alpha/beta hydrolase fold-3 domain-containing protein n=1 Tax=Serendipita vermifera MAFF 305830 TaxID=933852 RepID=A0A0C3B0R8_SERVB|nr:hypothetical protein M408DRAFT_17406 [Serendipita vermifera MAFF 305830]
MFTSPNYNVAISGTSTSSFSYAKIYTKVKIMRAGTQVGSALGRLVGELEKTVKPMETIRLPSSATSKRTIRVNIHRNQAGIESYKAGKPTAVHFNWHGSGWVLRGLGQEAAFIRQTLTNPLLADYPLTLLDCDYAKSPEWPCPADTEDARDVYDWVLRNPNLFDSERITLGGFSAGATIALGLSVVLGEEARRQEIPIDEKGAQRSFVHPIKGVYAIYPVATWQGSRSQVTVPASAKNKPGFLLPLWFSKIIATAHLFSPEVPSSRTPAEERARKEELIARPLVSPSNTKDVRDFSPLVVLITAEYDHLTRDTEALRERLAREGPQGGVHVFGTSVKGVGHGWDEVAKKGQVGYQERTDMYDLGAKMIARVGGRELNMDA